MKTETQHSPTPWEFKEFGSARSIMAPSVNGNTVEDHLVEIGTVIHTGKNRRLSRREANGQRLVAAVNACEGISTEALEAGVVAELLRALQSAHGALRSYQYGNSATYLAENIADVCEKVIAAAGGKILLKPDPDPEGS